MTIRIIKIALFALLLAGCNPGKKKAPEESGKVRIISTAPALTELVCAVGASDALVGRTDVCDYPPDIVKSIPVTGKFAMPNMEQVIVLNPTHLLESFLVNPVQKKSLERFGIKVEHIHCALINDIPSALRRTGEITGHQEKADKLAVQLENDIALLQKKRTSITNPPRTLLLLDHLTPITCGTNTFISEMATLAGVNNIASSLKKEYDNISMEWIIKNDPDLIICFFELKDDPVRFFKSRSGWKNITAVQKGRIIVTGNADAICRPGPRVLEGIEQLKKCIENIRQTQTSNIRLRQVRRDKSNFGPLTPSAP